MKPFEQFSSHLRKQIRYVLTDIDDTLTVNGRLPAVVFVALERLQDAKIRCIPITGRPAGWCDHIARMWPVDGLVGENGAFYFRYDDPARKMQRRYFKSEGRRQSDRQKLEKLKLEILEKVPGSGVSADKAYREADLAIDYCEDVPPRSTEDVRLDVIYIGDSPNDAPMFAYFKNSIGVANVLQFKGRMPCEPAWVTQKKGGYGFAEMVDELLAGR
jgi:hydroxymethylpyrimidine pyrophosphatase-like HAD family hydrolase